MNTPPSDRSLMPEKAARKLLEIANATEAVQDERIHIEKINGLFLKAGGSPAEYVGRFRFAKHFLGSDAVPAFVGTETGEEFQCAQAIDSLPQVKFWIRNVAKHPQSFWLPTASDKFSPDFVAQLADGRLLVIEYKGALLAGADVDDTNEKRTIGRLWEQRRAGKGLFIVLEKLIGGKNMRRQLIEKECA